AREPIRQRRIEMALNMDDDVENRLALHAGHVKALKLAFVRAAPDVHLQLCGASHPDRYGSRNSEPSLRRAPKDRKPNIFAASTRNSFAQGASAMLRTQVAKFSFSNSNASRGDLTTTFFPASRASAR